MSRTYHIHIGSDETDLSNKLDSLVAKYNLTTFIKIAVTSYLSTEEGDRLYNALAAKGELKKRKRQQRVTSVAQTRTRDSSEMTPSVVSESAVITQPAESREVVKVPGVYSTEEIVGRILKAG